MFVVVLNGTEGSGSAELSIAVRVMMPVDVRWDQRAAF